VFFEELRMALCAGGAHSESVLIGWAGADVPEFPDVLWRKAKLSAIPMQVLGRLPRGRTQWAVALDGVKQYVGVNQYRNPLQVTTGRDTSSLRQCFVSENRMLRKAFEPLVQLIFPLIGAIGGRSRRLGWRRRSNCLQLPA